jgi:hypothetical protein
MWPPPEDPPPPSPSSVPSPPPSPPTGGPDGTQPPGASPQRQWLRWAAIALGVVTAALVILAIILVVLPAPSPPTGLTQVPSPSATTTPLPTDTPPPTPTATPAPTPTPAPPPNTSAQQAAILFPGSGTECGANGVYAGCPVTNDLVAAATRWRSHHPNSPVPLCRCQSTFSSPQVTENKGDVLVGNQGDSSFDAVDVVLSLTGAGNETIVVLFHRQSDGAWLAYDTYCGGGDPHNRLSAQAPTTC